MSWIVRFRRAWDLAGSPSRYYAYIGNKIVEENRKIFQKIHSKEMVNHPDHYNPGTYECIKVMQANFGSNAVVHFCILNAFKYIYRCDRKDHMKEDLKKASWYLQYAENLLGESE